MFFCKPFGALEEGGGAQASREGARAPTAAVLDTAVVNSVKGKKIFKNQYKSGAAACLNSETKFLRVKSVTSCSQSQSNLHDDVRCVVHRDSQYQMS